MFFQEGTSLKVSLGLIFNILSAKSKFVEIEFDGQNVLFFSY